MTTELMDKETDVFEVFILVFQEIEKILSSQNNRIEFLGLTSGLVQNNIDKSIDSSLNSKEFDKFLKITNTFKESSGVVRRIYAARLLRYSLRYLKPFKNQLDFSLKILESTWDKISLDEKRERYLSCQRIISLNDDNYFNGLGNKLSIKNKIYFRIVLFNTGYTPSFLCETILDIIISISQGYIRLFKMKNLETGYFDNMPIRFSKRDQDIIQKEFDNPTGFSDSFLEDMKMFQEIEA